MKSLKAFREETHYYRTLMNAIVGITSVSAFVLAAFIIFLIESHNARALLFLSIFTTGVIGLVLSVALAASMKRSKLHITPFEVLGLKQYWGWQTPDDRLLIAAIVAVVSVTIIAIFLEIVEIYINERPIKNFLTPVSTNNLLNPSHNSLTSITVLIPARNEELSLPLTLASLQEQTRPPDKIIVVADNCTDSTSSIAIEMGYQVFETVGNTERKAGALNQALASILPAMGRHDVILVMDADSQINDDFLANAAESFHNFPDLDAVGGVFFGEKGRGILGQLQRNEFTRYSDQIKRRGGRVFVLTGTASLFRARALSTVAKARGTYIPGQTGQVYDTAALTEDNELTIALKTLGCPMISPPECRVTTELMPTWKSLWGQRIRWQRGAIENLGAYGFTRTTMRYWGQQIAIAYGAIALSSSLILSLVVLLLQDHWVWYPFWIAIGGIFALERIWTVRKGGSAAVLLALPIVLELAFDIFLQLVFVKVLFDVAVMRRSRWASVKHAALDSVVGS